MQYKGFEIHDLIFEVLTEKINLNSNGQDRFKFSNICMVLNFEK